MINQIMPGVQNPLLAIAAKIREQISQQAMTPPQTSPPTAGMPQDRDYTEGMERPELTAIKSEKEFKATPSRTTAFLVALGNILQDKQNLEAAKQQTAQNEYNAKLSDAMELNKLFKTNKMKREFDESNPDTLLDREIKQAKEAREKEMFPLKKKYKQTVLDRLLMKEQGGGGRASGGASGVENISEPELAKLLTPEQLATRKAFKTKAAQDRYTASILMPNAPRKMTLKERAVESYMAEGMDYITALKTAVEEEAANRGKGNIRGQIEGAKSAMGEELAPPVTPMPQPPVQAPAPKYVPGTIVKVRGKVMKITNAQGDLEEVK
ncbi:MAG TPA: hypothetical protein PLE07_02710 [Candidatus Paceibacterota bacterium]|nr:hypothetical protein [Candidatus Paceibacterota bacterium]